MSQQAINTSFDTDDRTLQQISDGKVQPRQIGELVVGVRVDTVPAAEAARLAADGKFYPLTLDHNGFLRVTLAEGNTVKTEELEVLRELCGLMAEVRDLLLKIA